MNHYATRLLLTFVFLVGCCLTSGCSNPVNKDNYGRLRVGMLESDVDRLLGKGKEIPTTEAEEIFGKNPELPPEFKTVEGGDQLPAPTKIDLSNLKGMRWGSEKKSITVIFREGRVVKFEAKGM